MMRVNRVNRRRLTPARSRRAETVAETVDAEPDAAPDPPHREHMFGSQYRVRMSFDELMGTRGYLGEQVLAQRRRRLVASTDAQRQRDAATRRAGYLPGEVLWPSE